MNNIKTFDEIYDLAVKNIKNQIGLINISIGGIPKTSKSYDIIGNCIQEWIPKWLEDNGLELTPNKNSQQFPDFIANLNGKNHAMEVKCWKGDKSPSFDLANFDGFYRAVYDNPEKLNAKYLIFSYEPTAHGFVITNIYLKDIWEITKPTKFYPIGLQVKQKNPYAIRPYAFHRKPEDSFNNRREFVEAIKKTREKFQKEGIINPNDWFDQVEFKYKQITGEKL